MRKFATALAILFVIGLSAASFGVYYCLFMPTARFNPPRIVTVERGESLREAARALARHGVIHSSIAFLIYAEMAGKATLVKPGDYAFKGGETTADILRHLVNGDFMAITVTVSEGMTIHQIGERLEAAGLACGDPLERAARGGPLVEALGLGPLGAEGFLFPATYRFSPRANINEILNAMIGRFFSNLTPAIEQRMFALGLSLRQTVTLASIIEKEAKEPGERPLIASVFYNRLARGMPLQSDPTAQYNSAGEMVQALAAIRTPSPFNTYDFTGLPPGPIANPGLSSIEAALYPAHTDYMYFVARSDGTHIFSRTFKEHERAIAQLKK